MNIDKYTTKQDILLITPSKAYKWVKTGHWCLREFTVWFETKTNEYHAEGYLKGSVDASDS